MLKRVISVLFSFCLLLCLFVQNSAQGVQTAGTITTSVEGLVLDDPAEYSSEEEYVNASLAKIVAFLDLDDCPDWLKVLVVHDFLCEFITYDLGYRTADLYEVLIAGRGVCNDYAHFAKQLLTKLDVNCRYVACDALNHAWNIVEVQGKWYNMDVTWDDGLFPFSRENFLKCDESFLHLRGSLGEENYYTSGGYRNDTAYVGILIAEEDFFCDYFGKDLYWAVSEDDTLTVYGSGDTISLRCSAADVVRHAIIPEGITTIGGQYAENSAGLCGSDLMSDVSLPVSLTYIGTNSFQDCYSLTDVYYAGSEAQWNEIEILPGNEALLNARIHFAVSSGSWQTLSGICGKNLTWTLEADKVLRIRGTGEMYDYAAGQAPWQDYASDIYALEISDGVTSIGSYAFDGCYRLVDSIISSSVTSYGDYAFSNCAGLRSFSIGDTVSHVGEGAFFGCSRLRTIQLTSNISRLPDKMFYGCERLWKVTIPEGITNIGDYCFYGCTCFSVNYLPVSLNSIGEYAFAHCTVMDEIITTPNVTEIAPGTFYGCTNIRQIDIPDYITAIGAYAFAGCDDLETLIFHGSPLNLGDYAFSGCGYLKNLDLNGVTAIGEGCFSSCGRLKTIEIPETVAAIGIKAFGNCSSLELMEIPGSVTSVADNTFEYCTRLTSVTLKDGVTAIGANVFYNCVELEEIILPDSVTVIGNQAFSGCHSLESIRLSAGLCEISNSMFSGCPLKTITVPGTIRVIGSAAFSSCTYLESVILEYGVTSIGAGAFYGCRNLTNIEIPDSVTYIGNKAFNSCRKLKSIYIPCGITTIDDYTFASCSLSDVYFGGNEELWNRIDIGIQNSALTQATMHFAEVLEGYEGACNATPSVFWCLTTEGQLIIYGEGNADFGGWGRFKDRIHSITILPGVLSASGGIFRDLTNLTVVQIPDTVTALDSFSGCSSLSRIELPDSVTDLGKYTFLGCSALVDVKLPAQLKGIPEGVFAECAKLEKITIPEQVTYIGNDAFNGCTNLKDIHLPAGLTDIGEGAFFGCSSLASIAIPAGVTVIEDTVFYGCSGLTGIEFPDGVTTIGADVFANSDNLTCVILPATLTNVDEYSFGMNSLVDVYYAGNEEEWHRITIKEGNHRLKYANIHYQSGQHLEAVREENRIAATCKADGGYDIVTYCTVCTKELQREHIVLHAPGHQYVAVVTLPTCTKNGYTTYTCSTCGDHYVGEYTNPNHNYQVVSTTEPCCAWNGYTTYRCSECNAQHIDDYVLGGHRLEMSIDAPTCQRKGYTIHRCTECELVYATDPVDPVDHVYEYGRCKWCDEPAEEDFECADHAYGAVVTEPTCTEGGYTTYTCANCGHSYVSDYVEAIGHEYEDGSCIHCGEDEYTVEWKSANATLTGSIFLNFSVELSDNIVNDPTAFVRFTCADKIVEIPVSEATTSVVNGVTRYRFPCQVYAKQMTDTVTAQVMTANGPVGEPKSYSVAQYCNALMKQTTNAELIATCKAMLNYAPPLRPTSTTGWTIWRMLASAMLTRLSPLPITVSTSTQS